MLDYIKTEFFILNTLSLLIYPTIRIIYENRAQSLAMQAVSLYF